MFQLQGVRGWLDLYQGSGATISYIYELETVWGLKYQVYGKPYVEQFSNFFEY
jgi:hypothetical protein